MKTAIVYDKWLHSLGGGEVVAVRLALALKKSGYCVTFVAGKYVSYQKILDRLGLDISAIPIHCIWNDELALQKITEGKDLFVNTTFLDYTRGHAKKNVYYTHFPSDPWYSLKSSMMSILLFPLIKRWFNPIEHLSGSERVKVVSGHMLYQLQNEMRFAVSYLNPYVAHTLKYSLHLEDFSSSEIRNIGWKIKDAKILSTRVRVNHHHNTIRVCQVILPRKRTVELSIFKEKSRISDSAGVISVFNIVCYSGDALSSLWPRFERFVANKMHAGVFENVYARMRSYDKVFSNSLFVQNWITRFWGIVPSVLYPPVGTLSVTPTILKKKQNQIVSVGRFFVLGHSKRQDAMIEAFKKLYDSGAKDWSLHLVGGLGSEESSQEYFQRLKSLAKGYPIFFHVNLNRSEVEKRLLSAKIYWHMSGLNERRPERKEHFGIALVEALSAGCWPVVFNGGGLTEIISVSGLNPDVHLFSSRDDCVLKTQRILRQPPEYDRIKLSEKVTSLFSEERYEKQFLQEMELL